MPKGAVVHKNVKWAVAGYDTHGLTNPSAWNGRGGYSPTVA